MDYEELKEKVTEIWAEIDGSHKENYEFHDFLRDDNYGIPKTNRVKYIEHDGGGEGGGEYCYTVIQLDGVFYKIEYNYQSYNGFDFDYAEAKEVVPIERMVTFYE